MLDIIEPTASFISRGGGTYDHTHTDLADVSIYSDLAKIRKVNCDAVIPLDRNRPGWPRSGIRRQPAAGRILGVGQQGDRRLVADPACCRHLQTGQP